MRKQKSSSDEKKMCTISPSSLNITLFRQTVRLNHFAGITVVNLTGMIKKWAWKDD